MSKRGKCDHVNEEASFYPPESSSNTTTKSTPLEPTRQEQNILDHYHVSEEASIYPPESSSNTTTKSTPHEPTWQEQNILDHYLTLGEKTTKHLGNIHLHRLRKWVEEVVGDDSANRIEIELLDCDTLITPAEFIDYETKAVELVVNILLQRLEEVC